MKEKVAQITPSLPPGVSIKPFYDRSTLIERAIDNFDVVFLRNEDSVAQMGRGRLTREELAEAIREALRDEAREVVSRALHELREAGLVDPAGEVEPEGDERVALQAAFFGAEFLEGHGAGRLVSRKRREKKNERRDDE